MKCEKTRAKILTKTLPGFDFFALGLSYISLSYAVFKTPSFWPKKGQKMVLGPISDGTVPPRTKILVVVRPSGIGLIGPSFISKSWDGPCGHFFKNDLCSSS